MGIMLETSKYTARLTELGFSEALLRFLTDDERDQLERIVSRFDARTSGRREELERAGKIIWSARSRAEMRHPGYE
jgi:hypothetical protein